MEITSILVLAVSLVGAGAFISHMINAKAIRKQQFVIDDLVKVSKSHTKSIGDIILTIEVIRENVAELQRLHDENEKKLTSLGR